jgi:hypothetical protein
VSFLITLNDVLAAYDKQDYLGEGWDPNEAIWELLADFEDADALPREALVELAAMSFSAIARLDAREPEREAFEDAA